MMDNKNEIVDKIASEIPLRMINLKKYDPYFMLKRSNKKYPDIDMCSIVLGLLGYLLYEVEIKQKNIIYSDIQNFLLEYTKVIFNKIWEIEEIREFTDYVLNKMQNDGSPFIYDVLNVEKQKMEEHYVRYITFSYNEAVDKNCYSITTEGIDFYLQTKEFSEESKVTIHLLLLKKMIENNDYSSALNQIINVNAEVRKLVLRKRDIVEALITNGIKALPMYESYKVSILTKCDEEKDLFRATETTINGLLIHLNEIAPDTMTNQQKLAQFKLQEIGDELKATIEIHNLLINQTVELGRQKEEILLGKRANSFKEKFDFETYLQGVSRNDNALLLEQAILPLLSTNFELTFSEEKIEDMELIKDKKRISEEYHTMYEGDGEDYVGFTHVIEKRVIANYTLFLNVLFDYLITKEEITIKDFVDYLKDKEYLEILYNPDFHTFLFQFYSYATFQASNNKCVVSLMRFHDLNKYVREYLNYANEKQLKFEPLVAQVVKNKKEYAPLQKTILELYPKENGEELILINDQEGQESNITNYTIRRMSLDEQ